MKDIFSLADGMTLQNGKYTIVRMLSHGGFGVTYLARHNKLNVNVCIKEFFPSAWCNRDAFSFEVTVTTSGNAEMVDRFLHKFIKEAQSIARLNHEGIVKVHDVFEENGTAYYVMDYIEGQTLQEIVKTHGALSTKEAVQYISQAANALDYLHGEKMNHLDVKPANMMINSKGKLILIDFGVAKHYGVDGHQTTTTPMCVSRGYSPIEQYDDGGVSHFSPVADIYALGATLYFLLTGNTPPEATKLAVDEIDIPSNIPPKIANTIRHAMKAKQSLRTPSIRAFLGDLSGDSIEPPVPGTYKHKPQKKSDGVVVINRKKMIIATFSILALIIVAAIIYSINSSSKDDYYSEDSRDSKAKKDTADTLVKEEKAPVPDNVDYDYVYDDPEPAHDSIY